MSPVGFESQGTLLTADLIVEIAVPLAAADRLQSARAFFDDPRFDFAIEPGRWRTRAVGVAENVNVVERRAFDEAARVLDMASVSPGKPTMISVPKQA